MHNRNHTQTVGDAIRESGIIDRMMQRIAELPDDEPGNEPKSVNAGEICPQDWSETLLRHKFPARHVKHATGQIFGHGAKLVESFREKVLSGDSLIVLSGNRGTGKTQAATEWEKLRLQAGQTPGQYTKCADMIGLIKRSWGANPKSGNESEDAILEKLRTIPYLVIDEFHERGASDWECSTLVNILDHRYDNMVVTVIIANFAKSEIQKHLNASIIDRANETGGLVFCDWESYRKNEH